MWMRYAAFAAPILLVGAITVAIVLTSDAGPQLTSAAVTESRAVASPPADPQATVTPPCAAGAAVGAGNDGLAADCALLLGAKDPLRGTATLNWSASLAIADWTGVTLGGTPQRVTELSLVRASLDGSIPGAGPFATEAAAEAAAILSAHAAVPPDATATGTSVVTEYIDIGNPDVDGWWAQADVTWTSSGVVSASGAGPTAAEAEADALANVTLPSGASVTGTTYATEGVMGTIHTAMAAYRWERDSDD